MSEARADYPEQVADATPASARAPTKQEQIAAAREALLAGLGRRETPQEPSQAPDDGPDESQDEVAEPEASVEQSPEEDQVEIQTLVDFAKAAGWEPADLYALKIRLDQDGEEVALGELKDRLQNYRNQETALQEQWQQLQAHQVELENQAKQLLQGHQQISEEALTAKAKMRSIEQRFAGIDWDQLREKDPARYAALQQDLAVEYSTAKSEFESAQERESQQRNAFMQQHLAANANQLMQVMPGWKDPQVARQERDEIVDFLIKGFGFTPGDVSQIADWRVVVMAKMALEHAKHQEQVGTVKAKVKAAPKPVLRAGSGGQAKASDRKVAELVSKARRGTQKDKVTAARAVLQNALAKKR